MSSRWTTASSSVRRAFADPDAVLAPDTIDAAAENWVVAFQDEPEEALAQLVTFLLRLCGCDARVDAQAAADADALGDALAHIEDAWAPHATSVYPLVSRARPLRHARKHAARLLAQLLHDAADAEVLGDATLLGALQTTLVTLAQSPLRAFRHTATLVTLWVLEGLAAQLDATRDAYLVAERQRAAEAHRTGANRTRAAHSAQRMEHLDTLRDTLDAHLDALVRDVWTPRVCDVDAHIRAACIEQLGTLLQRHPMPFVQDAYLRPLGAALSDPDGGVRLHALRAAQHVCVPAHDTEAHAFVTAHAKRLRDMALYDVELRVRVAAFALLAAANALGALARDDAQALAVHLFDADAQIRVAAAGLVATLVGDAPTDAASAAPLVRLVAQYDAQLTEHLAHARGSDGDDDDEHDGDDDIDSELLDAGAGRVGVAADALWDARADMQVWRPYLDLVLDGAERPAHEEAIALELLVAGVRLTRARNVEVDGVPAIEACSDELATALPRLLAHFSGDAARLADVLRIVPHLDLGVYTEPRHARAFDALWDDVCAHLVRHTSPRLLHAAARALERLAAARAALVVLLARALGVLERAALVDGRAARDGAQVVVALHLFRAARHTGRGERRLLLGARLGGGLLDERAVRVEARERRVVCVAIALGLRTQRRGLLALVLRMCEALFELLALGPRGVDRARELLLLGLLREDRLLHTARVGARRGDLRLALVVPAAELLVACGVCLDPVGVDLGDLVDVVEAPQHLLHEVRVQLELDRVEAVGSLLLLAERAHFGEQVLALGHERGRVRDARVVRGACRVVLACERARATHLVHDLAQVLGALRGDRLDVALEHEKVARLDEDVELLEPLVVQRVAHDAPVVAELGAARGRDGALEAVLDALGVLDDGGDRRAVRRVLVVGRRALARALGGERSRAEHEVLELRRAQLRRLDAEHERNGVHQVAFAAAIGADWVSMRYALTALNATNGPISWTPR